MGSPKDITGSLTRWQRESTPAPAPAKPAAPQPTPQRRLRSDLAGGLIYTVVIGTLVSQVIFLLAFDLF